MNTGKKSNLPLLASIAVIVILAGGLGYYYVSTSGKVNSLESSLSSEQSVAQQQSSDLSNLQGVVTSQQVSISALNGNVSNLQAMIVTLNGLISTDNQSISSYSTQNAQLNSQITAAHALISNLTETINLQVSKVLLDNQTATVYGTNSTSVPFLNFTSSHPGFVVIKVSSATEPYLAEGTYTPGINNPSGATFQTIVGLTSSSPAATYFIMTILPNTTTSLALVSNSPGDGMAVVSVTLIY
jgi:type II secretory pathway pseudopilin PulG